MKNYQSSLLSKFLCQMTGEEFLQLNELARKDAGEFEKYNNDRTLSKSIDNMTQTLTPILESNTVTFRTLLRQRMAKWKKWPRWKNLYTYMYIFIGLLFMFVFTVSL